MAISVQSVVDAVKRDQRGVFDAATSDDAMIADWADRIHKDILRHSIYSAFNRASTTITSVANTVTYTLSPTDILRLIYVYDTVNKLELNPAAPFPRAEATVPPAIPDLRVQRFEGRPPSLWPREYLFAGGGIATISLYPAPSASAYAGVVTIHYEKQIATVAIGGNFITPDDSKDLLVAGTNYLAARYIKRAEPETAIWLQLYERLKQG